MHAPLQVVLGWSSGSIGAAVLANTYGVLLLRFITDNLGIAAATGGAMIALSKLFDAAVDPLIGSLSDRLPGPMGRRRPFLLLSTLLCPLALIGLFIVPRFESPASTTTWVFMALMFYSLAYALWTVPYMAMAAEITDDYRDRSRLIAFRTAAGTLGQLLAASCGPWLLVYWGGTRVAHERMALVLAVVIAASCAACFVGTRRARFHARAPGPSYSIPQQLHMVWVNRPFRWLVIAKFMFFGLSATTGATNAFFSKYILQAGDFWLGTYYVIQTAGTLSSMPCWVWLGRRHEKRSCMLVAVVLFGATSLSWIIAGPHEPLILWTARVFVMSFGLGGFILFGQSMLPDAVEYDYRRTGLRREGVFAGIFVLIEKISTAGGIAIIGMLLGFAGYVSAPAAASQPASALLGIRLCFSLLPTCGAIACFAAMLRYDLTEAKLHATPFMRAD